ncbi:MAG: bifunctional diaminohydroxyphosphoribosylaminopyrimidine deaminase/5-amino-6-(5-phosphoribosylamino)uracil reductase RibD [Gemmatimonadales bacterium]
MTEREAMHRAVELAWNGWGRVAPNPLVGCVILQEGVSVGEGWHAEYGGAHAEQMALAAAGDRARGATAVVTLEPCAHTGKQPPCVEALIAAGVARVVFGAADPNAEAAGGAARLQAAGVAVEDGVLAGEVRHQNAAFFHRHQVHDRPWTVLKLAMSLDARIADATGRSQWISGEEAREWVHWLRAGVDAIAVGGATVRADNPRLTARGTVTPRCPPRRVVFVGRGSIPADSHLVATAAEVATIAVVPPGHEDRAVLSASGVRVVEAGSLPEAMGLLKASGVDSLLVEGGGRLAGALLADGLVDRCCLIQAPLFLGTAGVPAVAGWPGGPLADATPWNVVERRALGRDTLLVLDRG